LQLVDERIVGAKPATLDFAEAAAVPLTALTAWEMLFDRLEVKRPVAGAANAVLILGAAGGVGSIAVQLARRLTDLSVIGTASRGETADWARELGAHHVLDHARPLAAQVEALGLGAPAFVFSITHSDQHLAEVARLIAPQGRYGLIDDPASFDVKLFKAKSVSLHWEAMFTRPVFATADMARQGEILDEVARLIDQGVLRTTASQRLAPIDAANLAQAHAAVESHRTRGKIVLEGWG
jgi:zinc-binding alcohol dehydrogenase family protein